MFTLGANPVDDLHCPSASCFSRLEYTKMTAASKQRRDQCSRAQLLPHPSSQGLVLYKKNISLSCRGPPSTPLSVDGTVVWSQTTCEGCNWTARNVGNRTSDVGGMRISSSKMSKTNFMWNSCWCSLDCGKPIASDPHSYPSRR